MINIFGKKTTQDNSSSDKLYLERIISNWLNSEERKEMMLGERYYQGEHDILSRERQVINENGTLSPVYNIPNNRLVDNQYRKLVDQKKNYAIGKPLTVATPNETYQEELENIFNRRLHRQLQTLAQEAIEGGIAWLYPYYDEQGEFRVQVFPSYEVCPIWKDREHVELEMAIRVYKDITFTDTGNSVSRTHADIYSVYGVDHFILNGTTLVPDETITHSDYVYVNDQGYNWERIPIIPFKYNAKEIPLIRNVKVLQDSLNLVMSDFQNNMEEDPRSCILVLKNYDGTNIPEFRRNLATYGVIKVTTVDGVQGGVEALKVDVDATNYQAILMQLKRSIIENGYGFDAKEERMDGDPNQMNIESMYTDIDLDVDGMETMFQDGFEDFKWFIDQYLLTTGKGDFTKEKVEFVFNRDIFINENAMIDNCVKSVGLLSNKTVITRHPWVTDVQTELNQIEEDKAAEIKEQEDMMAFESKISNTGGGAE